MINKRRVFTFHLLNDRSGSPKVLSQLIKSWVKENNISVYLYTNQNTAGFLSQLKGVQYHKAWYKYQPKPLFRLLFYSLSQLLVFFQLLFKLKKDDIVYVNTVLPFAAAIVGKLKGCRIVYHIHEATISPTVLKWFLLTVVKLTATEIIYVSAYVKDIHGISSVPSKVVYNAIEDSFLAQAQTKTVDLPSHILMICSLKVYKGVLEFLNLAKDHPNYKFKLVLNATSIEINDFFKSKIIPDNLVLYSSQVNLHPFYQWADIIVNLSLPNIWVETFGLTIIEGMAYGLPAIVPPVGGILEVIQQGVTGYSVDARNREQLNKTLAKITQDKLHYFNLTNASKDRIAIFKEDTMCREIAKIVFC